MPPMPEPTRLDRLRELADKTISIYSDAASEALESGEVPRYALMTSEGSAESTYTDNPNLTVHETTEALADQIAGELDEGWAPLEVIDLETGETVGYRVKVEITTGGDE